MEEKSTLMILEQLVRIADSLDVIARAGAPQEPAYIKPIGEYAGFDWGTIGASVVNSDRDGPTHLEWGGYIWTRRSPSNKFNPAVWYSRATGKDDEGNTKYLKLITFRPVTDAEPIPDKVSAALERQVQAPKPPAAPSRPQVPAESRHASPEAAGVDPNPTGASSKLAPPAGAEASSLKPLDLMTMDDAAATLTDTGKPYGDLTRTELANRYNGLSKILKDNGLTPAQRELAMWKRKAAEMLLSRPESGAAKPAEAVDANTYYTQGNGKKHGLQREWLVGIAKFAGVDATLKAPDFTVPFAMLPFFAEGKVNGLDLETLMAMVRECGMDAQAAAMKMRAQFPPK